MKPHAALLSSALVLAAGATVAVGVLAASGLIAGEALMGLVTATFNFFDVKIPEFFKTPSYTAGLVVLALLALTLIYVPLSNAGRPEDPPPPAAFV